MVAKLKVWSVHKDDSCALEYSIQGPDGKVAQQGKAVQGKTDDFGLIDLPNALITAGGKGWKIKFSSDRDYAPIDLNLKTSVAIGSGDRYSYGVIR